MWIGAIHVEDESGLPVTLVETNSFARDAASIFSDAELAKLKMTLACDPEQGVVIKGTGGLRKIRCSADGRGKSHGARVIYYYCDSAMPIFLIAVYRKSERIDLSENEKKQMKKLIGNIRKEYSRSKMSA